MQQLPSPLILIFYIARYELWYIEFPLSLLQFSLFYGFKLLGEFIYGY